MKYNRTEKAIDVLPELDREYFNIQSLKSAVWQYMIDHAQFIRKDLLLVKFFIPNNVVFWDRVWARKEGKFLRNQMKQFNDEGQEILDHVKRLEQNERDSNIVNEA